MLAEAGSDTAEPCAATPKRPRSNYCRTNWAPVASTAARTSGSPPLPQRKAAVVAVVVELDRQNLVQLNDIGLETEP